MRLQLQRYSEALFTKKGGVNLCVPGGKDTARMLKKLYEEMDATAAAPAIISRPDEQPAPIAPAGITRDTPAMARFRSRTRLNKKGSEKETWHIEFDLTDSGIEYWSATRSASTRPTIRPLADAVGHPRDRCAVGFSNRRATPA